MITVISGVPGSGKSYYAVNYLYKYVHYDKLYDSFELSPDTLLITNIDNLKLNHISLDDAIKKYTFEVFFSVSNFEKIRETYKCKHIILIIDECQRYFDTKFYDKNILYLFEYHRHIGLDVFFISQNHKNISFRIVNLCEYIIEAQPRSKNVLSQIFTYKYFDLHYNFLRTQRLTTSRLIFKLYQSYSFDEHNKPQKIYRKLAFTFLFVVIGIIFTLIYVFPRIVSSSHSKSKNPVKIENNANKGSVTKSLNVRDNSTPNYIYANSVYNVSNNGSYEIYYLVYDCIVTKKCYLYDESNRILKCSDEDMEYLKQLKALVVCPADIRGQDGEKGQKRGSDSDQAQEPAVSNEIFGIGTDF